MLVHPQFDPVAFTIGPLTIGSTTLAWPVRWYGLMYLLGFIGFLVLGRWRARQPWRGVSPRQVEDFLFWGVIGVIVGGRLGYVLFYLPGYYLEHPLEAFMPWKGGMASHGGILGVTLAMALYARAQGIGFLRLADFVVPLVPLGLAFGRLGNFINGELWGRPADPSLPWAMVFPQAGDAIPRHPSQLYQMGLEGIALFVLLLWYSRKPRATGAVGAAFLFGYGVFRVLAEFAREPDSFLGPLSLGLSMGQWLSMPMVLGGAGLWLWCVRRPTSAPEAGAAR